jgi:hypothetical protein
MIELETMLMQFCLETSGRLNGDRYPVGKGNLQARGPAAADCLGLGSEGAAAVLTAESFCGRAQRLPDPR